MNFIVKKIEKKTILNWKNGLLDPISFQMICNQSRIIKIRFLLWLFFSEFDFGFGLLKYYDCKLTEFVWSYQWLNFISTLWVFCVSMFNKFQIVKCKQVRCAERTMGVCVCLYYNWLKGVTECLCVRACFRMYACVCDAENRRFFECKSAAGYRVESQMMHFVRRSNERCRSNCVWLKLSRGEKYNDNWWKY